MDRRERWRSREVHVWWKGQTRDSAAVMGVREGCVLPPGAMQIFVAYAAA